jgi:hypothetical protein
VGPNGRWLALIEGHLKTANNRTQEDLKNVGACSLRPETHRHYQHLNCMAAEISCLLLFIFAASWLRPIKLREKETKDRLFPFSNID